MRRLALPLLVCLGLCAAVPPAGADAAKARDTMRNRPAACSADHVRIDRDAVVHARMVTLARARSATLCLLNRARARHGLRPLRVSPKLARAARAHSHDMVKRRYFQHNSPNGRTPFQRMLATRYVPGSARWWLGENIGWGIGRLAQPRALVRAWLRSAPHRANILSRSYREIGIGIAFGAPRHAGDLGELAGATYTTDFGSHG